MANSVRPYSIGGLVGIAIGLIGLGLQWKYPDQGWLGKWVAIGGFVLLAITIIAYVSRWHTMREYERTRPLVSPPPPSQQLSQNATINPVIAPVFAPSFNQSQSQQQSQRQDLHSRFKNTKLDFECISAGFEDIELSPRSSEILPRLDGQGILGKAAIAEFRRNADEPAIDSFSIRSQIARTRLIRIRIVSLFGRVGGSPATVTEWRLMWAFAFRPRDA